MVRISPSVYVMFSSYDNAPADEFIREVEELAEKRKIPVNVGGAGYIIYQLIRDRIDGNVWTRAKISKAVNDLLDEDWLVRS